ncbi:condensation domain-containing protein, partial [Curtanaerobium respiraculi]
MCASLGIGTEPTAQDLIGAEVDSRFIPAFDACSRRIRSCSETASPDARRRYSDDDISYLLSIVCGRIDPSDLLVNDRFAPDRLFRRSSEGQAFIKSVGDAISSTARRLGRGLRIAEYGCRTGCIARELLSSAAGSVEEYCLIDTSEALIAIALDTLGPWSHLTTSYCNRGVVDERLCGRYDLVIAAASLHASSDTWAAVRECSYLAALDAQLMIAEPEDFDEESLLPAALVQCAFPQEQHHVLENLLPPEAWLERMQSAGFNLAAAQVRGNLAHAIARKATPAIAFEGIREDLAASLPDYMHPSHFGAIARVPLSANGKVDTSSLRVWAQKQGDIFEAGDSFEPPRDGIEQDIAQVWSQILRIERIDRHESFFALGGDSLSATRMIALLAQQGMQATLRNLFASPTLAAFAKTVAGEQGDPALANQIVPHSADRYEPFPLTEVQLAYTVGREGDLPLGSVGSYCFFLFSFEDFEHESFMRAWMIIFERHDMLRTRLEPDHEHQRALRASDGILPVSVRYTDESLTAACDHLKQAMSHRAFDLTTHFPFEVCAMVTPAHVCALGVGFDNTMIDGLSMSIVLTEFSRFYQDPPQNDLEPDLRFRDYVTQYLAHREMKAQDQAFWKRRASTLPPAPQIPLKKDPADIVDGRFSRIARRLDRAIWGKIADSARKADITQAALLLACYAKVLSRWSGGEDVTVNLTVFDRPDVHPDTGVIVGDFTTLLPIACPVSGQPSAERSIKAVQCELADALEHRSVSTINVQRELSQRTGYGDVSMPVVFTCALGVADFDLGAGILTYRDGASQTPQVWIDHQVMEYDGGVLLSWDYVRELFPEGLI